MSIPDCTTPVLSGQLVQTTSENDTIFRKLIAPNLRSPLHSSGHHGRKGWLRRRQLWSFPPVPPAAAPCALEGSMGFGDVRVVGGMWGRVGVVPAEGTQTIADRAPASHGVDHGKGTRG